MCEQSYTNKTKWLVLSYYANVDGRAASHHIDDRLSAIRAAGIDVTVLSSTRGPRYRNEQHLRVFSLMPSAMLDELKAGRKRNRLYSWPMHLLRFIVQVLIAVPAALLYVLEKGLIHRDKRWSWQYTAAMRGWLWSKREHPDLIMTTGGPASAHVAGAWLAERLDVPLICEFQDPLPFQYPSSNKAIHDYHLKLEQSLSQKAKALVYLTDGAAESAKQRLSSYSTIHSTSAFFSITSGAPVSVVSAKLAGEKRVLTHIGTLSGTRNLDVLLESLSALAQDNPDLHKRFVVQLAGTLDKPVVQSIESFALKDNVELLGRQPRDALDRVIANADILLLIQNTGPIAKETIPSKAFEYLQTGRPILGLINGNTQLRSILTEHGHAVHELDDDSLVLQQQLRALLYEPLPQIKPCKLTVQNSVNELIRSVESVL